MAKRKIGKSGVAQVPRPNKRVYLSQSDVPKYSLEDAMRVATAIASEYAKQPTAPLNVAVALQLKPASSHFRGLCGAALAYGLTNGGPQADQISLTDLGKRIVAPKVDGEDITAKRQALLTPRVLGEFLRQYDKSKLPRPNIAVNVLEAMGVPADCCGRTFELIVDGAREVGFLRDLKGDQYVDLSTVSASSESSGDEESTEETKVESGENVEDDDLNKSLVERILTPHGANGHAILPEPKANRRVFVTHGKNRGFIDSLKQLLLFGEFEPVVSIEKETVSLPVPDKVMEDMRSCSAAIIHVDAELDLMDKEGNRHQILNPNVLIEIGAAMALYGQRIILLLRKGITIPSNLQGLYRVEYEGEALDGETTIRHLRQSMTSRTGTCRLTPYKLSKFAIP